MRLRSIPIAVAILWRTRLAAKLALRPCLERAPVAALLDISLRAVSNLYLPLGLIQLVVIQLTRLLIKAGRMETIGAGTHGLLIP